MQVSNVARAVCVALVAAPCVISAQTPNDTLVIAIADAHALALRSNPDLLAARPAVDVARGQLRQGSLPQFNPALDVLPGRGGLGQEFAISQELEIAGQRGARVRAGRANLDRTIAEVLNVARITLADVTRAFYRVAAGYRRVDLARELVRLNENLVDISSRQLKEGEISRLDFNLASVELGRSRARMLATQSEREQIELELRRLIGSPPQRHIVPVMDSTWIDFVTLDAQRLIQIAIENRPDVQARAAVTREAEAQALLARRARFPNLAVRGVTEQGAAGNRVWRPGIGVTIPLLQRNQGEIAARAAAVRQAQFEREALVSLVRAEIQAALSAYAAAVERVAILETSVLPQARENRRLLEIAYREGEVGLPVLLLIRNQVIDAELEYWDAWQARHEALASLSEATGQDIPLSR